MPRKKRDDYEEDNFLDEAPDDDWEEVTDDEEEAAAAEEQDEESDEDSKDEGAPEKKSGRRKSDKGKPRKGRSAKSKKSDDESASEDADDDDADDDDADEKSDKSGDQAEQKPEEEEIDYPPDDKKAVAALQNLKVRLDVSEKGNVWRVIFDDSNGRDQALVLLKGLPALRELWLLGTRISKDTAKKFDEEHPKITVYY